jgi:hypothetical protein
MLKIMVKGLELYDERINEFSNTKDQELQLEHSLVSLSKWESKWLKPFLTSKDRTKEESMDYIKAMTITQNVDPQTYLGLTSENFDAIAKYIEEPMTATTFVKEKHKINNDIITSEIIYYWMITLNVPFECQKWHLNKLLALINVCNLKNQPKKKVNKKAVLERNAAINAARKEKLNTSG